MIFKGKPTRVIITGDAKEELAILSEKVSDDLIKGRTKSENCTLLNSIRNKIDFLKENPEYGIHIPKDRIPKSYLAKYGISNLWKINLSGAWRMLYTIKGSEVEIISIVLDILDHDRYDKRFGYKKR